MAAALLKPLDSHDVGGKQPGRSEVDILLEEYLYVLNDYQIARKELHKGLETGFLSLAQANFTSSNRIHHGRDHYDDRMQASRRIIIKCEEKLEISIKEPPSKIETSTTDCEKDADSPEQLLSDPATWYGAFVSPALRDCQRRFISAIDPAIRITVLQSQLKSIEDRARELKSAR